MKNKLKKNQKLIVFIIKQNQDKEMLRVRILN